MGRGTATHDGTAIAWASLRYLVDHVRCLVLFVTHYPVLGELAREYPTAMANFHMSYLVTDGEPPTEGGSATDTYVRFPLQTNCPCA